MIRENVTGLIIGGMEQERVTLTLKELQRAKVMERLRTSEMSCQEAAEVLGISRRQVIRLKKRYAEQGDRGLIHGNRGKRSRRRIGDEMRSRILELYQQRYHDFNFSHFTEWLREEEGLKVSRSSVERVLKAGGIASKKSVKRKARLHRARPRRASAGELWQTDATTFEWFGKGKGYQALHAYIDDATGVVVGAYFTKNECTDGYVEALKQGVERYGLPMEIYSDRHTIFRSPKELSEEEAEIEGKSRAQTDFGRGLAELGIGQIFAMTPQAKGRIERLWETLQDRLAAELRRLGIEDIEGANEVLSRHNRKFAVKASDKPVYVPLGRSVDFGLLFAHRQTRKTDSGGMISYKGKMYVPAGGSKDRKMARASVEVRESLDGRIYVVYQGKTTEMQEISKPARAEAVMETEEEKNRPVKGHEPAPDHPWRHFPIGKARSRRDTAAPIVGTS